MVQPNIPFSSLYTNNPIELFWVNFNSAVPIFQEYFNYISGLLVILMILLLWTQSVRTRQLNESVQKLKKRSKTPTRPVHH
jgi:uncharacterized membrane protein